jgi:membrane protease YdiL (CAAX protease family)
MIFVSRKNFFAGMRALFLLVQATWHASAWTTPQSHTRHYPVRVVADQSFKKLQITQAPAAPRSYSTYLEQGHGLDHGVATKKIDKYFDGRATATVVAGQSVLIVVTMLFSLLTKTPNFGLGPNVSITPAAIGLGALCVLPFYVLFYVLDSIEDRFPALQDISTATEGAVLGLLGSTFKPVFALLVSTAVGVAAGVGEEMMFRGILQYEITKRLGSAPAVVLSSVVFGMLHAVTPWYALLASLASVYFGVVYSYTGNLVVPIACRKYRYLLRLITGYSPMINPHLIPYLCQQMHCMILVR